MRKLASLVGVALVLACVSCGGKRSIGMITTYLAAKFGRPTHRRVREPLKLVRVKARRRCARLINESDDLTWVQCAFGWREPIVVKPTPRSGSAYDQRV